MSNKATFREMQIAHTIIQEDLIAWFENSNNEGNKFLVKALGNLLQWWFSVKLHYQAEYIKKQEQDKASHDKPTAP